MPTHTLPWDFRVYPLSGRSGIKTGLGLAQNPDRKLEDGRSVAQLHKRGQQVRLSGLKFPVHLSWYYFKREDGKWEKRACPLH